MWLEVVERESGRDGSRESERESFVLLQTLDALAPRTTNRRSANRQRVSTVKDALAGALVGATCWKSGHLVDVDSRTNACREDTQGLIDAPLLCDRVQLLGALAYSCIANTQKSECDPWYRPPPTCLSIALSQPSLPSLPMLLILESCIEHVQSHLVTFLSSRNRHQPFVAVVLRLIDLDHTPAQMANLIDLGATLANDGPDHVIWNKDLLS